MTIFSDNPYDRRIERFMTAIPNFKPRGVGVRFSESQILITVTTATPTEILAETMRQIRCPPFRKRFNEYIESEEKPMTYINEKHRARFELAAKNIAKTDGRLCVYHHRGLGPRYGNVENGRFADGKAIHRLMEKDRPFPQDGKRLSHSAARFGRLPTVPQRLRLLLPQKSRSFVEKNIISW